MIEDHRILRGARVVLRPLGSGDLRRCVKWFSDPQVLHFLGRSGPMTLAEEERWFHEYRRRSDEQIFAIEVDGKHVGNLGLHKVDRVHRKAELGIVIGEPGYWSRGFGTDALRAGLGYGFDVLGLNKISLEVLEYNERGIRAYVKCGFQREGVHREEIFKDGRFFNVLRMSVLYREYTTAASAWRPRAGAPAGPTAR